jgi:4-amino-4-deoxy-L-arabinose transferase-like glycosyltransferase
MRIHESADPRAIENETEEVVATVGKAQPVKARTDGLVVLLAALVFLCNIGSPPHLMDDVDAVQAQIARNMLASGDWVTARLDGVAYLEKSPMLYWMMAVSFRVFGVHDWSARLPLALSCVFLCWVLYRFGRWAFDEVTGTYAGIVLSTCIGLYLFTRILIPDAIVTLSITVALWAFVRLLDEDERHPGRWAVVLGASLGCGLLLKGLIAVLFPALTGIVFLLVCGEMLSWSTWRRLRLPIVICACVAIAAPWHILAAVANPPYLCLSLHSVPGEYHGFTWFYFINEHLLRFLNRRYPRDYNTVPRIWFWLLNLVWLFPWSVYLPAAWKVTYSSRSRADRVRLLAVCWIGVVMLFFTFSTTQEYYSMPIYPALALLIAVGLRANGRLVLSATNVLVFVTAALSICLVTVLIAVRHIMPVGDISQALTQHPEAYTLSLGHMSDLTLNAFAYLKTPLALAAIAFALCAGGLAVLRQAFSRGMVVIALSMAIFFQASRLALVRFDSYLGSFPLARALAQHPPGQLIEADAYYAFSSVFFYSNRTALLLNGRSNNLEYGSYAPHAQQVFIDDTQFSRIWKGPERCYLLLYGGDMVHVRSVVGQASLFVVAENAGNYLLSNWPVAAPVKN